ncbi:unnamed protein product [Caenorhabditis auriculariae]|uniref:Uncharacterized protein n=1 Tax=Caenorhabditis auriculariae TaxID=2777116 RepID=A0A8S1HUE8_9PELO|nr:unnamed protein product [Caenorhabditis auriculariae]
MNVDPKETFRSNQNNMEHDIDGGKPSVRGNSDLHGDMMHEGYGKIIQSRQANDDSDWEGMMKNKDMEMNRMHQSRVNEVDDGCNESVRMENHFGH